MAELSEDTKNLISQYRNWRQSLQPKKGVTTIHVDEIAARVAAFYEKIRIIVDWKEEHLMRRAMIIRKLKRRFLSIDLNNPPKDNSMAESLILELIRGGHFPNDRIEEIKFETVQRIINKYVFILRNRPQTGTPREKIQLYNWILEIAACEIEENLASSRKEIALINYMFDKMKKRIFLNEGIFKMGAFNEEEKNIQIYIAVQQALFKLDSPIISYNLIKYKYPDWNNPSSEWLSEATKNIYNLWRVLEGHLSHPLGKKFYAICEKYDTPYLLLGDILSEENQEEALNKVSEPEVLESSIKKAYNKRLSTLKKRLYRAALYSTLSVLLGNIVSIFFVEYPLAKWLTGTFAPVTIVVDILGPTFLMFLLTTTIKLPSKNNLNVVIMETMKIVYKSDKTDTYEVKVPKKRTGIILSSIIALIYAVGALVSFGFIVWIFELAGFPPTSIMLNIMFVALITFAGLAIRKRGQELTVQEKSGGFFAFIFDVLSLPVAATGHWLSVKWKRYNAIAAFFNALIDMPFSIFVEFIEQWRFFLKERKEEIH